MYVSGFAGQNAQWHICDKNIFKKSSKVTIIMPITCIYVVFKNYVFLHSFANEYVEYSSTVLTEKK